MDKTDRSNNKTERLLELLDALENPDGYSDDELQKILSDPDIRNGYGFLAKMKAADTPLPTPDVDAEWESLQASLPKRKPLLIRLFGRKSAAAAAAVFAVAAVAAGIAFHRLSTRQPEPVSTSDTSVTSITSTASQTPSPSEAEVSIPEISESDDAVTFKNESLETIIDALSKHYGVTPAFKNDGSRQLRLFFTWDRNLTLPQVAEMLNNFEQINVTVTEKTITID